MAFNTRRIAFVIFALFGSCVFVGQCLEMKNKAYEDFTIQLTDSVPATNCKDILANLEATIKSASQYLFSALDGRTFIRSATVVLPPTWPDYCAPSPVISGSGDLSDLTILPISGSRGKLWTQQSLGCGQQGDQIYLAYEKLEKRDDTIARSLVKEFAMYRYGVFEEMGYQNDPVYPMCYHDDETKSVKLTGCSDLPISHNGICDGRSQDFNITKMVDEKARSSIMFAAEAPSVSMFCDEGNHDRYAPTKHNLICERKSTFEVIRNHADFAPTHLDLDLNQQDLKSEITDTSPRITYKKQNLTRYVLVIENTKEMVQRESWSFLKHAIRKWSYFDLPDNTEVGMVLTNDTGSMKMFNLRSLQQNQHRDYVSSELPFSPGDSTQSPCLHCALKEAIEMISTRNREQGPASNVIVLIAPGITNGNKEIELLLKDAKKKKIRMATINYPDVSRTSSLDFLAEATKGKSYTILEKKINVDTSSLSTYFQLSNALYDIIQTYYSGNIADLPIEIHRKEIKNLNQRTSITGSFVLDDKIGEPARFMLYTHSTDNLLIKRLKLTSPNHETYERKSESMIQAKVISLVANISEPGTWTYTIEPYAGNPQPHFLQVMATPLSRTAPVVRAKFWTHRNQPGGPLILLTEVKYGDHPVLGAKVEVEVTKVETNGTVFYNERLELLDTGSGDPDITRGDGVYTRYFSAATGGPGVYSFEVTVTDNGNTAYSSSEYAASNDAKPCCGSLVPTYHVQVLQPFQRVLPPTVTEIPTIEMSPNPPPGRIGNLKVELIPEELKARLIWTSPDMGGHTVDRYEIRYAENVEDIADHLEINALKWEEGSPFPLPPGSDSTFTLQLHLERNKNMLDKPLYFAIKAYPQFLSSNYATVSNWIRIYMPSPPPPPTAPPTYSSHDNSWPFTIHNDGDEHSGPSVVKTITIGLEIILPVVIGIIILVVLLIVYCYFCVLKRRAHDTHKKGATGKEAAMRDKLNSTITIIPNSPTNSGQIPQGYTNHIDVPDHHTVGVPINPYDYDDDPKKSYSLVHQQEQQLIEELKQQQHNMQRDMNTPNNNYGGLSVISNNSLQRNGGHTLSPYNSWSASQLLHEHERRHSPMEEDLMNQHQDLMSQHQDLMNQHQDMLLSQHQEALMNQHQEALMNQHQDMLMNGSQIDHMSLNGHQIPEHYTQGHVPPPVPPLPVLGSPNGYPVNYNIYGVHQPQAIPANQHPIYQSMQRNEQLVPFNPSLQGSMSSVNSGEKKRRNVTMV